MVKDTGFDFSDVIIFIYLFLFLVICILHVLVRIIKRALRGIPLPHTPLNDLLPNSFIHYIEQGLERCANIKTEPKVTIKGLENYKEGAAISDNSVFDNQINLQNRVTVLEEMQQFEYWLTKQNVKPRPAWSQMRPYFLQTNEKLLNNTNLELRHSIVVLYEKARYLSGKFSVEDVEEFSSQLLALKEAMNTLLDDLKRQKESKGGDLMYEQQSSL